MNLRRISAGLLTVQLFLQKMKKNKNKNKIKKALDEIIILNYLTLIL